MIKIWISSKNVPLPILKAKTTLKVTSSTLFNQQLGSRNRHNPSRKPRKSTAQTKLHSPIPKPTEQREGHARTKRQSTSNPISMCANAAILPLSQLLKNIGARPSTWRRSGDHQTIYLYIYTMGNVDWCERCDCFFWWKCIINQESLFHSPVIPGRMSAFLKKIRFRTYKSVFHLPLSKKDTSCIPMPSPRSLIDRYLPKSALLLWFFYFWPVQR